MDKVSIIIPHYGSDALTNACVDAVVANTLAGSFELIIVDNGTGDKLPGRVIRNNVNRGFAVACNQGAAAARNDLVLFLNNDTEPHSGWLPPLVSAVKGQNVAAASGLVVLPDGEPWQAHPKLVQDRQGRLDTINLSLADVPYGPVRFAAACALLLRKGVFDEVDGFDEGYWNGHEDIDLCLKLEQRGWTIFHVPPSVVMHRVSQSGDERFSAAPENIQRLTDKWKGKVSPDLTEKQPSRAESTSLLVRRWLRRSPIGAKLIDALKKLTARPDPDAHRTCG